MTKLCRTPQLQFLASDSGGFHDGHLGADRKIAGMVWNDDNPHFSCLSVDVMAALDVVKHPTMRPHKPFGLAECDWLHARAEALRREECSKRSVKDRTEPPGSIGHGAREGSAPGGSMA